MNKLKISVNHRALISLCLFLLLIVTAGLAFAQEQAMSGPPDHVGLKFKYEFYQGLKNAAIIFIPVILIFITRGWQRSLLIIGCIIGIIWAYNAGWFNQFSWYSAVEKGQVRTYPAYEGSQDKSFEINKNLW